MQGACIVRHSESTMFLIIIIFYTEYVAAPADSQGRLIQQQCLL